MVWVGIVTPNGLEGSVDIKRSDLVAEVKCQILKVFPFLKGQMLNLSYRGKELSDETTIDDCGVRLLQGMRLVVSPNSIQPFAPMDYERLSKSLIDEGLKRKVLQNKDSYTDEWTGKWNKGKEFMNYPPVDVNNPFSAIPPSSSRELVFSPKINPSDSKEREKTNGYNNMTTNKNSVQCEIPDRIRALHAERERRKSIPEQEERERNFRRARQKSMGSDFDADTSAGSFSMYDDESANLSLNRTYQNLYTCILPRGLRFSVFHKTEGKWVGDALYMDANNQLVKNGMHVYSSRIGYRAAQNCWSEQTLVTNSSGISKKHKFLYFPVTDGVLYAETDHPTLRKTTIKMQEIGSNIIIIHAIDTNTGVPVLSETITYSNGFHKRVRSGQRFNKVGDFQASYISTERKFIDEDSGAVGEYNGL